MKDYLDPFRIQLLRVTDNVLPVLIVRRDIMLRESESDETMYYAWRHIGLQVRQTVE